MMDDLQETEDALVHLVKMLSWLQRVCDPSLTDDQDSRSENSPVQFAARFWPEFLSARQECKSRLPALRPWLAGGPPAHHLIEAPSWCELVVDLAISAGTHFTLIPPDPSRLDLFRRHSLLIFAELEALDERKLVSGICSEIRDARRYRERSGGNHLKGHAFDRTTNLTVTYQDLHRLTGKSPKTFQNRGLVHEVPPVSDAQPLRFPYVKLLPVLERWFSDISIPPEAEAEEILKRQG